MVSIVVYPPHVGLPAGVLWNRRLIHSLAAVCPHYLCLDWIRVVEVCCVVKEKYKKILLPLAANERKSVK